MKLSTIVPLLFLFFACGCGNNTSSPSSSDNNGNNNDNIVNALATIENDGDIVAYITSFGSASIGVYIPSVDRYANYIRLADGSYTCSFFYWSGPNCTGTPIINGFSGEVGKTVLYDGLHSNYYRVTSLITIGTTINYQSFADNTCTCTNVSNSTSAYEGMANVSTTTRPYNFSSLAPLKPKFH